MNNCHLHVPRLSLLRKSLKSICVDSFLFFAIFVLVGHLSINFWERYTIQNELCTMKASLHTLKDTITNIGTAYDNLHVELKDLFSIVEKKKPTPKLSECARYKEEESERCKKKCTVDRKKINDYQVRTLLTQPNKPEVSVGVMTDKFLKSGRSSVMIPAYKHKSTEPLSRNIATNTKNPSRSTGITSDLSNHEYQRRLLNNSRHERPYHTHYRYRNVIDH